MPFEKYENTAVLLPLENIDTDQIIPARYLKATTREGFGEKLFQDWRYHTDGSPKPDFVLNQDTYTGNILVTGKNFGCGSSREHAAWALADYGFKTVISSFFADIFKNNALNNNLLPIVCDDNTLSTLWSKLKSNPKMPIWIDLPNQQWGFENEQFGFEINEYKKECLMKGLDNIDYLLSKRKEVATWEEAHVY